VLRSGRSRVCRPADVDGSWVDARHARRRWSGRARRSPTLRPSSVGGSQSASSLPRGRSRLAASRSIESLDTKRKRNESRNGSRDSFRNPPRRPLILCFPVRSADQLVTHVATWVWWRLSRSDRAGARTGLSTGPRVHNLAPWFSYADNLVFSLAWCDSPQSDILLDIGLFSSPCVVRLALAGLRGSPIVCHQTAGGMDRAAMQKLQKLQ
jgi:hypothetical protein